MSNYSFMKSGFSNTDVEQEETLSEIDIVGLVSLFVENAMKTASKHTIICKRNVVTKTDVTYGLIYEVFNWLKRPTLIKDFQEIKNEIENEAAEEEVEYNDGAEDKDNGAGKDDDEDEDEADDDSNGDFENIEDIIVPDEYVDEFERAIIQNDDNKEFLEELYSHYDNWPNWVPQNNIEKSLKSSIDRIINEF